MRTRPTQAADIPALQSILTQTDLFPADMLPNMIMGFLSGGDTDDLWITCEFESTPVGFCYAAPEQLADGTWNMLAIAIDPKHQASGCGSALTHHLENTLKSNRQRILIVDTSGTDAFQQTRAFYAKNGYTEEARIRDYWAPGDDKVIFWKSLK